MKLITEGNAPNFDAIENFFFEEVKLSDGSVRKQPRINGIFIQTEVANRNGRVYPRHLMETCVDAYKADRFPNKKTRKWRTYGELGHPEGVEINLHRVSHIVDQLEWDNNNNVLGSAKLVDTEYGRTAQTLLASDGQLGVSSRGVGALGESIGADPKMVTEYELIAIDIVSDPSAPEGFVDGILESVDFIRVGGKYTEASLKRSEDAFNTVSKMLESLPKHDRNEYLNYCIKEYLNNL